MNNDKIIRLSCLYSESSKGAKDRAMDIWSRLRSPTDELDHIIKNYKQQQNILTSSSNNTRRNFCVVIMSKSSALADQASTGFNNAADYDQHRPSKEIQAPPLCFSYHYSLNYPRSSFTYFWNNYVALSWSCLPACSWLN